MTCATSSGPGSGSAVDDSPSITGSPTSRTRTPKPANRSANSAVLNATTGAVSASMNSTRDNGSPASIGTYADPDFNTPKIATIASADRANNSATTPPGPAPQPTNARATRFAASSNSRYVHHEPSHTNATASGVRATCAANNPGTDPPSTGPDNTTRLPHRSSRARSNSSSRSTDDSGRSGSAVRAPSTRSSRPMSPSTVEASKTSVRNSTITSS